MKNIYILTAFIFGLLISCALSVYGALKVNIIEHPDEEVIERRVGEVVKQNSVITEKPKQIFKTSPGVVEPKKVESVSKEEQRLRDIEARLLIIEGRLK